MGASGASTGPKSVGGSSKESSSPSEGSSVGSNGGEISTKEDRADWKLSRLLLLLPDEDARAAASRQLGRALAKVHALEVAHTDGMGRNVLWNPENGGPMIIDFERALMTSLTSEETVKDRQQLDAQDAMEIF